MKYDKSIICPSGRIKYCFRCSFKPFICKSNGKFYVTDASEKYRLTHFKLISDVQRKRITHIDLGNNQNHPHKHPRTNYVCMGKWKGILINDDTVKILAKCLIIYDENDCYEIPEACRVGSLNEIIYGGNQCLTF